MSWADQLQRASFGGVPFGVFGGQIKVGRRNAVHEYPFKDEVWVEDLGRAARRITLTGFLVENGAYGGGAVIEQREQMIAVCESAGQSTLVHPTLGSIKVSLLDSVFTERWDRGRVFEIGFSFIESGERTFPSEEDDTGQSVDDACDLADAACGDDFFDAVLQPLGAGQSVIDMAVGTTGTWANQALSLASDATNLMNTVGTLSGSFGRFVGSGLRGITGSIGGSLFGTLSSTLTGGLSGVFGGSLSNLMALGAMARSAVMTAVNAMESAAASLTGSTALSFAVKVQAVPAALLAATTDPADGVRGLSTLAGFKPSVATDGSAIGISRATMQSSCGDLFRRAAVVSVCRASARYQPASFDDAVAVRTSVTTLLDTEIQVAGDQGQDATYNALRSVRAAVVKDLTARGANLSSLTTITSKRPMPALVLAQRVYRDSTRADELVTEADPIHPAFMPTSFKGLSS